MDFNSYFNNPSLESILKQWQEKYPDIFSLSIIGQSYEKRPIWLATVTNRSTGPDAEKPAVWVDANIHATEVAGTTTVLYFLHTLLMGYDQDPRIKRLVDESVYYVVPRVNPDGAELAMAPTPRYIRSGVRNYPWDEKEDGLHMEDIDRDGRILQMRIVDPNGEWKISGLDPRLMELRRPDEREGTYYRLFNEGLVENYDGFIVKDAHPQQGLDFNRNFPFDWRPESDQTGAGPYPTSEPEIKTLADFITNHLNINIAITFHTFSRVILRPYSTKADEEIETDDLWVFNKIGEVGTKITGYRCVSTFHDFKYHPKEITTGGFDDWLFDHLGIFTYTIELWDLPTAAGIPDRKFIEWFRSHPHEEDLKILKWADENGGDGAYVNWYPYDHPQLGKVELGGWNFMYTWRNPPHSLMSAEAALQAPFLLSLGDMLPHLVVHTLELKHLGDGDYSINLVVENTGFLPTFTSQQGKKRKVIRPVRVELELPENVTLVSGKRRTELGHLEGRSNKLEVAAIGATSPTDNRNRIEWVIRGQKGSTIGLHILSDRAGSLHSKFELT
jgi:murein tripeptide amidase MpaA